MTTTNRGPEIAPRAVTGRLTVNPGDPIVSSWGNTTYDQTVECFASTADRDTQWPTPHDGAICYTGDTGTLWLRRAGAWQALAVTSPPQGFRATATGPAGQIDYTAFAVVVSLAVPVIAGRRYRLNAALSGGIITNTAGVVVRIRDDASADTFLYNFTGNAQPAGAGVSVAGAALFTAATTKTGTFGLYANVATGAGALRLAANSGRIWVEDIGTG